MCPYTNDTAAPDLGCSLEDGGVVGLDDVSSIKVSERALVVGHHSLCFTAVPETNAQNSTTVGQWGKAPDGSQWAFTTHHVRPYTNDTAAPDARLLT